MNEFNEFFPHLRPSGSQPPSERQGTANQASSSPPQPRNPADISLHDLAPLPQHEDPADISLHDVAPPQQHGLRHGIGRLINSPPQMMQRSLATNNHHYMPDPHTQQYLQDSLPSRRSINAPGPSRFRSPYQGPASPQENRRKRKYTQKMTAKKEGTVPFLIAVYLALHNSKSTVPVTRIYDFVKLHFPSCITPGSDSWQKSIRENVAKKANKHLFVKEVPDKGFNLPTQVGKRGSCKWGIKEGSHTDFNTILNKWLGKKGGNLSAVGITDMVAWQKIINGTMGLPTIEDELLNQLEDANLWDNSGASNEDGEEEENEEPLARRPRMEEEANRAADGLGKIAYEQYEVQHNGYPRNVFYPNPYHMAYQNQYQYPSYMNFYPQPTSSGYPYSQFNYLNTNDYDPNGVNDLLPRDILEPTTQEENPLPDEILEPQPTREEDTHEENKENNPQPVQDEQ